MDWRWACIVQFDTVQLTAHIAHSQFICNRNNEMDMRWACIVQLDMVHRTVCMRIHRGVQER